MIDRWEVDGDLVSLEEEIGEGAFGKVYKGTLKEPTSPSQKRFLKPSLKRRTNYRWKGDICGCGKNASR